MPVDESICNCLTSIMTSAEKLMRQFFPRMQVGGCKESFADTFKEYPLKNLEGSTVTVKISESGMQNKVKIQRDILSTLLSNHHKAPPDIEAAMAYPLPPVSLALCNADGSIRKTKKSPLYKAALAELVILNPENLPPEKELSTYFLDFAAAIRLQLKDCETIKQLESGTKYCGNFKKCV